MKMFCNRLLLVLLLVIPSLEGYTFKVCYCGSDDAEVDVPDSITVNSVIHGGSTCWAPNFSVTVNKGESKDIVVEPGVRRDPAWNSHVVPETANGNTVRAISDPWPLFNVRGSSSAEGETWHIKKTKPVVETFQGLRLPGMRLAPISVSTEWFAEIQEGLHDCQVFAAVPAPVKMMFVRPLQADQQAAQPAENVASPVFAMKLTTAQPETSQLETPIIVDQETWLGWVKFWGPRIGIPVLLYALARQIPGSPIQSVEGSVGNIAREASNYLHNTYWPFPTQDPEPPIRLDLDVQQSGHGKRLATEEGTELFNLPISESETNALLVPPSIQSELTTGGRSVPGATTSVSGFKPTSASISGAESTTAATPVVFGVQPTSAPASGMVVESAPGALGEYPVGSGVHVYPAPTTASTSSISSSSSSALPSASASSSTVVSSTPQVGKSSLVKLTSANTIISPNVMPTPDSSSRPAVKPEVAKWERFFKKIENYFQEEKKHQRNSEDKQKKS